ncbi:MULTISPECIES: hypothetical protein [unclassified Arthrobacter]|uniref:hypothetical protein n=1 Tax=unclassified Arthrobacter TaxID=235627 RepID=UPI001C857D91|nr:hypothetical protein [Arthrobacter sp. MAHUQ-56]MBX7443054.1 hypothetical protein [Arthrobacter sp. MAHUQ-56]
MRPPKPAAFLLASTTAAAALSLAGCASDAGSGGLPAGPAVQAAAAGDPPSIVPAATSSAVPAPAGMVTYTFPDGRLSFAYPEGWHVEHEQVLVSPPVETVTVHDAAGKGRVNIYYSEVGDATGGPATRFVLETDPVPGLLGRSVPTPHSSFYVDHVDGGVQYRMGLTPGLPVAPDGKVQYGLIMLGPRMLTADVLFTGAPFANDEEARAWYWGSEGQTLKALLMSFTYC